jgi:hypothetical protein
MHFVDAMAFFGDLNQDIITFKLITLGANGVSVFQHIRTNVTI